MKTNLNMRSGFSMIELVFVIVILAILSAVAIPRLTTIQDDALISTEKSAIGVARQGVVALYGKRVIRGDDFNITLTNKSGVDYNATVYFTSTMYPVTLTVKDTTGGTSNDANTTGDSTSRGDFKALALVVESESLADWSYTYSSTDVMEYRGPASNTVTDGNAEINTGNYWKYDNSNGKLILSEE